MPKEQDHSGEFASCSTSKNDKEKSNSATLRASQAGGQRQQSGPGDTSKNRRSCDSEKDSGYSEAGSDDQHSIDRKPKRASCQSAKISTPQEERSSIYVFKNLQSGADQLLHGPLSWAGGWQSLTTGKTAAQLVLIQQPVIASPANSNLTSSSGLSANQAQAKRAGSRGNPPNSSSRNSYLPILNSYPRIAPHPGKELNEGKSSNWVKGLKESGGEGQSLSKRVRIEEEKRDIPPEDRPVRAQQHPREARGGVHRCSPSGCSCHPKPQHSWQNPHSTGSPSISSSQTPSPPSSSGSPSSSSPPSSTAHSPDRPGPDSTSSRQRRFLNTAEILNQSGLLAITLRTKELLKQNAATEREIIQLRQHTQLLCHIAKGSQGRRHYTPGKLDDLFQDMDASGSYPSLDLEHVKMLSCGQQESRVRYGDDREEDLHTTTRSSPPHVVTLYDIFDGVSPPSPLFAPSPDAEDDHCKPTSSSKMGAVEAEKEEGLVAGSGSQRFPENSVLSCLL